MLRALCSSGEIERIVSSRPKIAFLEEEEDPEEESLTPPEQHKNHDTCVGTTQES